jgi:uncharacterized phage protein (TIGR01671 family)
MIETKFRIWIPYAKRMMQPKSIITIQEEIINGPTIGQMKSWVYLQFIGLQDKNGKDIYDGNVLKGMRVGSNSDREYTGVIEWRTEQAGWVIKCGKFVLEILSLAMSGDGQTTRLSGFEVIGNIQEHPELLTPSTK